MVCARCFFFSSRRRHTRCSRDWSSDVCSSDLILKGEDFAGLAQTTSEDPGSAAEGGDLGWAGPGTFAPEFEQAIAGLKDNEISEPFHTQFGWHIAQVLGHRRFDNTDELKPRQAMEAIRAGKADEETELWLRRMRDEAFVEFKS